MLRLTAVFISPASRIELAIGECPRLIRDTASFPRASGGRLGWGRTRGLPKSSQDGAPHILGVLRNLLVHVSQDGEAPVDQLLLAPQIRSCTALVVAAVNLNDELRLDADEVDYPRSDGVLPPEEESTQSAAAEHDPNQTFSRRRALTHLPGVLSLTRGRSHLNSGQQLMVTTNDAAPSSLPRPVRRGPGRRSGGAQAWGIRSSASSSSPPGRARC